MKTALLFSGGKDSMACLYLYRDKLSEIDVIWTNTGKNYPEVLATIEAARKMCPNWHEVRSDRDAQWAAMGMPSDLVPVDWTDVGQYVSHAKAIKVQSYLNCCFANIIAPTWAKVRELGCTEVIRGQRKSEAHKAPAGDVDGIKIIQPIEDWSDDEVFDYLRSKMGELPEHYALEHSSMDCFDCTGYAAHSADRIAYTKKRHPVLYAAYVGNYTALRGAISEVLTQYERIGHAILD